MTTSEVTTMTKQNRMIGRFRAWALMHRYDRHLINRYVQEALEVEDQPFLDESLHDRIVDFETYVSETYKVPLL